MYKKTITFLPDKTKLTKCYLFGILIYKFTASPTPSNDPDFILYFHK